MLVPLSPDEKSELSQILGYHLPGSIAEFEERRREQEYTRRMNALIRAASDLVWSWCVEPSRN